MKFQEFVIQAGRLLVAGCLIAVPVVADAALVLDDDNASRPAYNDADGWAAFDDGSSNPSFLGGWVMSSGAVDGDNIDIASSTGLGGGSGAIDVGGLSFKIQDDAYVDLFRFFDPAGLSVGQTFSIDMAVNFRGGFKGIDLRDTSTATVFNFNIGGDDYTVSQADSGNGSIGDAYSSDTVFHLEFSQTSLTEGTWSIARSGGVTDFDSGTYAGQAGSIKIYSGSQGSAAEDALYFNNLQITAVPEASSLLLTGCGIALLTLVRRTGRR